MLARSVNEKIDKETLILCLHINYYKIHRERNYRSLKKRVITEPFYSDDEVTAPDEYKVLCFQGKSKLIQVDRNRFSQHTRSYYLSDWSPLPFSFNYPFRGFVKRPPFLDEILQISARIAQPFSFLRVDFLSAKGQAKISELTNCHAGGFGKFHPEEFDRRLAPLFEQRDFDPHVLLSDQ